MKLIVGLGNIGNEYAMTRHNIGFMVVDHLLNLVDLGNGKQGFAGTYYNGRINGENVIVLKPSTYMNNSGESVKQIVDYFKIDLDDIVVIHDDLDLPTGFLRLREHGADGGHNGIKSIDLHLGSQNYKRIRIGIGRDTFIPVVDYVLGKLSEEEKPLIKESLDLAAKAIIDWTKLPFNQVMNKYNKRPKKEESK